MFKVSKECSIYSMNSTNAPVLRVPAKSQVEFETFDCFENQICSEADEFDGLDFSRVNPATGPVYIEGAEPGDILVVKIEKIEVASQGLCVASNNMGVVADLLDGYTIKIVPIKNDMAIFNDKISLPINKMIGVIGVAPKDGEDIATGVPDYHGGNMDCKEMTEGRELHLPVNVPGALLAIGDLHAVMADGEICGCGLEISGTVTVSVDVIKNKTHIENPMLFSDTHIMTIASHVDLDIAMEMAVSYMAKYLIREHGFDPKEAAMLMSMTADVRICQVVDPKKTIRVEFPKYLCKTEV